MVFNSYNLLQEDCVSYLCIHVISIISLDDMIKSSLNTCNPKIPLHKTRTASYHSLTGMIPFLICLEPYNFT